MPLRVLFIVLVGLSLLSPAAQAQQADRFESLLTSFADAYGWDMAAYGLKDTETGISFDLISLTTADGRADVTLLGGQINGISETVDGAIALADVDLSLASLTITDMPVAYNALQDREGLEYTMTSLAGAVELLPIAGPQFFDLAARVPVAVDRNSDTELRALYDGITLYLDQGIRLAGITAGDLTLDTTLKGETTEQALGGISIASFANGLVENLKADTWNTRTPTLPRYVRREDVRVGKMSIQR